jgi:hypothetical protein
MRALFGGNRISLFIIDLAIIAGNRVHKACTNRFAGK